jgi:hypothetical protein
LYIAACIWIKWILNKIEIEIEIEIEIMGSYNITNLSELLSVKVRVEGLLV